MKIKKIYEKGEDVYFEVELTPEENSFLSQKAKERGISIENYAEEKLNE